MNVVQKCFLSVSFSALSLVGDANFVFLGEGGPDPHEEPDVEMVPRVQVAAVTASSMTSAEGSRVTDPR